MKIFISQPMRGKTDAEILAAIANGTDPETGEINNLDELMGLQMEREQKIENIACLVKNLKDDALKGWILPDDNRRWYRKVSHEFWERREIGVEVVEWN